MERKCIEKNRARQRKLPWRILYQWLTILCYLLTSGMATAGTMVPLTVTEGSGLIKLARTFCTSEYHWKELAKINNLEPPYRIFPGQSILVPLELLRTEKVAGHIVSLAGTVYLVENKTKLKKIKKGDFIVPGQTLVTENDGFAHIVFPDSKYARVASNSRFTLTYMVTLVDDSLKAEFFLKKGRLIHSVRQKLKSTDSYRTRTPVSVTGVRGTEFRVKVVDDTANVVESLSGTVAVEGAGATVTLPSGSGAIVKKGLPPGAPSKLPAVPTMFRLEPLYKFLPVTIPSQQDKDAFEYRIRITKDEAGTNTVLEKKIAAGESFKLLDLDDGRYHAFFTTLSAEGFESKPSRPYPFMLRTVPGPPILESSFQGKSLFDEAIAIQWLEQEAAQKYHLQLAYTEDFAKPIKDWESEDAKVTLKNLKPGQYYVRVQAVADDGFRSSFSKIDSWKIVAKPSLQNMSGSSKEGFTLTWATMGEGVSYDLQVSKDKRFDSIIAEASDLHEAMFSYSRDMEPGAYYVRVRGTLGDGQKSPWSGSSTIKIDSPPFSIFDGAVLTFFLAAILLI